MSPRKTILVVDDDQDLVRSVEAFLTARGFNVVTAPNGTQARAWLEEHRPDLIVLDIMMDHDTEGFNLAYKLNAEAPTRDIPIIILSGFMDHLTEKFSSFEHIQGRDWPAAKFFEKPVKLTELADAVSQLIGQREDLEHALHAH